MLEKDSHLFRITRDMNTVSPLERRAEHNIKVGNNNHFHSLFFVTMLNYALHGFLCPLGLTSVQLLSACCAASCVSGMRHHRSRCAAQCSTLPSSWVCSSCRKLVTPAPKKTLLPSTTALVSGSILC